MVICASQFFLIIKYMYNTKNKRQVSSKILLSLSAGQIDLSSCQIFWMTRVERLQWILQERYEMLGWWTDQKWNFQSYNMRTGMSKDSSWHHGRPMSWGMIAMDWPKPRKMIKISMNCRSTAAIINWTVPLHYLEFFIFNWFFY